MSNMTNHERFIQIHCNWSQSSEGTHYVLKDKETGVLYYMVTMGRSDGGIGLTPLLDSDGKPLIDK